jgi:site-specific recombinase XerD
MPPKQADTIPERYDQSLLYARDARLPPDFPRPQPTKSWPQENIALLECYAAWLSGGGASKYVISTIYIPMAGHVLGLALKPYAQLDLDTDLQPALDYVIAKGVSDEWTKNSRNSLAKFRRFLIHQRGQLEPKRRRKYPTLHTQGLPDWLVEEITRYQHICQRNWRDARLEENIHRFWSGHLRLWRFLCQDCGVQELSQVRRKQLFDYVDLRLASGSSVSTINGDLRNFVGLLRFLQEQDYAVPQALLRLHNLKQPERLPKFLTDDQVRVLREDFERRLAQARHPYQRRDALLDLATFYLLWQGGLRRGEVEELRLEDLDLDARRLSVRNGKGMKDRTVYLTDTSVQTLRDYLAFRGQGPTDHVFLYRNQPLSKDLIHGRLKAAGQRTGVAVHAHRLRHTCATQLLNAGCPVTSIQKFLGHKKLNTTMVYAKAYDQTVEADYFAAMQRVEQRLQVAPEPEPVENPLREDERTQILALAEQLAAPEVTPEQRLDIFNQMRGLLERFQPIQIPAPILVEAVNAWIPPPGLAHERNGPSPPS